uniref:Uncharacterized protein n=1 Tax=Opuntia streptacantha TaxID=393608 RepID=A0A7C8YLF5_OPUST
MNYVLNVPSWVDGTHCLITARPNISSFFVFHHYHFPGTCEIELSLLNVDSLHPLRSLPRLSGQHLTFSRKEKRQNKPPFSCSRLAILDIPFAEVSHLITNTASAPQSSPPSSSTVKKN